MANSLSEGQQFYEEFAGDMLDMHNNEAIVGTAEILGYFAARKALIEHVENMINEQTEVPHGDKELLDMHMHSAAEAFAEAVLQIDNKDRDVALSSAADMDYSMSRAIHGLLKEYNTHQILDIPAKQEVAREYKKLLEAYEEESDVMLDSETSLLFNAVAKEFHAAHHENIIGLVDQAAEYRDSVRPESIRESLGRAAVRALSSGSAAIGAVGRFLKR